MGTYANLTPDTEDSQTALLYKIAVAVGAGTGGVPFTSASQTFTPNFVSVGASATGTIPANAKTWSFILLTGTGTLNGVAVPLNTPVSGGAVSASIAYTTGTTSSAFIAYQT